MRFFKYGEKGSEVLAIVLPGSLMRSSSVKEGDEYEFVELAPGAFFLASKQYLNDLTRRELISKLGLKVFDTPTVQQTQVQPTQAHVTPKQWSSTPTPSSSTKSRFESTLDQAGYLVVENENEAKEASKALESKIKTGEVKGVRGFDKKFYIVSKSFYETGLEKVVNGQSKPEFTAGEVTNIVKTAETGAVALLQVMKEEGQVIEKCRGTYALIK